MSIATRALRLSLASPALRSAGLRLSRRPLPLPLQCTRRLLSAQATQAREVIAHAHEHDATIAAKSSPAAAASSSSAPRASRRARPPVPKPVVAALVVFILAGFTFPFYLHHANSEKTYTASKPLTTGQNIRGAYVNSSTKDIGSDPKFQRDNGITPVGK